MRSGVVCVISHDRFHVEKDATDFVVILIAIFPVTIDIADAFHCINVIARELRDRGNLIPFPNVCAVRQNKGVINRMVFSVVRFRPKSHQC